MKLIILDRDGVINYDSDEPMLQMKKSFNDMINFLIELKEEKNTMH